MPEHPTDEQERRALARAEQLIIEAGFVRVKDENGEIVRNEEGWTIYESPPED